MDNEVLPSPSRAPAIVWTLCCAALLAPSLLVWGVRGMAYAFGCAPGPAVCENLPLGTALHGALTLAWALPSNSLLLLTIAFTAAIAAVAAGRALLGALTLIAVPVFALILPMLAVFSATYENCPVNDGGVGDCPLWGANMGMAFHRAANVNDLVYGFAPYTFAAALMLGLMGWFITRPRKPRARMAASMQMPDRVRAEGTRFNRLDQ